jgi:uncharacterized protein (UPF0276 family)
MLPFNDLPALGVGLGYREVIGESIIANADRIDWVEINADQFLEDPARQEVLAVVRERFPVVPHCLEMSIGSDDPLDLDYLGRIAAIADTVDAPWVSDHLCLTHAVGWQLGTLAPIERSKERARRAAEKARAAQDFLGRPLLLENITYYVDVPGQLSEAEFIAEVIDNSGCGLLLDLENLAVNAANHQYDPIAFLESLPLDRIVQVHVAGGIEYSDMRVDTHSGPVSHDALHLLKHLCGRTTLKGALIERDGDFPDDFDEILHDIDRTRAAVAS